MAGRLSRLDTFEIARFQKRAQTFESSEYQIESSAIPPMSEPETNGQARARFVNESALADGSHVTNVNQASLAHGEDKARVQALDFIARYVGTKK